MTAERNIGSAFAETPAQPFNEIAAELGLPLSTLHLLRARGQGPKCFRLGRRLYVSSQAKQDWIAARERDSGDADSRA